LSGSERRGSGSVVVIGTSASALEARGQSCDPCQASALQSRDFYYPMDGCDMNFRLICDDGISDGNL